MGDLIHTLPALTDAGKAIPGIEFDWVVEEPYAEIPAWHPLVKQVIPIALRRWRKGLLSRDTKLGFRDLQKQMNASKHDIVLDAQGLVKSAFLTWFAQGERVGLDFRSARESLASLAYQRTCTVNFYQHAVVRMRSLFSQALGYALPVDAPDFGLNRHQFVNQHANDKPYLVFLHGTTWESKQWPESYWCELANFAHQAGFLVKISGGNDAEIARAMRIGTQVSNVDVLPRLSISDMARLLANAKAAVAVDTGFGHLAAALDVPTVSIYGATNPAYTSAIGKHSSHLSAEFPCSPCLNRTCIYRKPSNVTPACYQTVVPEKVWQTLLSLEFTQ